MENPLFVFVDSKNDCFVTTDNLIIIGNSIEDITEQLHTEISKDFIVDGPNVFLNNTLVYKAQEISYAFYHQMNNGARWKKPSDFVFFF